MKLKLLFIQLFMINIGVAQTEFQEQIISVGNESGVIRYLDLDGDDDIDFITAQNNEILLYENDGQGNFSPPQIILTGVVTNSDNGLVIMDTGDIDNDGDNDILVSVQSENFSGPISAFWIENVGANVFELSSAIFTRDDTFFISLSDLDSDGFNDILETYYVNSSLDDGLIFWYKNIGGTGGFESGQQVNTTVAPLAVYHSDIDTDSDLDIIIQSIFGGNFWMENTDGLGTFANQQSILSSNPAKIPTPEDFDNDGDVDFLYVSITNVLDPLEPTPGIIEWYENTDGLGDFNFRQTLISSSQGLFFSTVADFDNDSDNDVFYTSESETGWFENLDGLGDFGNQQIVINDGFERPIDAVDIDSDGDLDVVLLRIIDNEVTWYENQGTLSDEDFKQIAFKLYPNPTSSKLFVKALKHITSYEIVDIDGRVLNSLSLTQPALNVQINLENLNQGVYFIKLRSKEFYSTKKIIKQ